MLTNDRFRIKTSISQHSRQFIPVPHGGLTGQISSLFVARMSQNTLDKDEVSNLRELLVLLNDSLSYNYAPSSISYFMTKGYLKQHPRIFDSIRLVLFPLEVKNSAPKSPIGQFRPFFIFTCPPTFRNYFSADANTFHCLRFILGPRKVCCH